MIRAYFAGGPEDMTSRALSEQNAPMVYRFAKMPDMADYRFKQDNLVDVTKLRYRLAYVDHRKSFTSYGIAFYVYDGEEK